MHDHHCWHLTIMAALSFIAMYILTHAMMDRFENTFPDVTQATRRRRWQRR